MRASGDDSDLIGKEKCIANRSRAKDPPPSALEGAQRGIAWWSLFSVLAVAVRGVRWDENFEFAQAMIGAVPYSPEHPLMQYTRSVFNGQTMASAALLKALPHPIVLNGVRNVLFLLATTLPAYLLGHVMGRRPLAGHVTVMMLLIGIHVPFEAPSSYNQFVWPGMFSNGHVGTGFVLAWIALFAGGYFRLSALMLGLLPAVHLGQIPAALLFIGTTTLYALTRDRDLWRRLRRGTPWFFGGLVASAMLYAVLRAVELPPVTEGPYFSDADPLPIWRGGVRYWGWHRQNGLGTMSIILACSTALCMALWCKWTVVAKRGEMDSLSPTIPLVYALGCVVPIVLTIMIVHAALAPKIPYLLLGWLPYRLLNHVPPVLVASCVAILLGSVGGPSKLGRAGEWIPAALMIAYLAHPIALNNGFYSTHFQPTAYLLVLAGAAYVQPNGARQSRDPAKVDILARVAVGLVVVVFTAFYSRFGAACLLLGAAAVVGLNRMTQYSELRFAMVPATAVLVALTTSVNLAAEWRSREHLPVGAFEQEVTAYLEARGEPDALLVGQPDQRLLQAKTGHPVLVDVITRRHAGYLPSLGPSVQKLHHDIYGMRFDRDPTGAETWEAVWKKREGTEWAELGQSYGLRYVVAPIGLDLNLDSVVKGELDTLYRIPLR